MPAVVSGNQSETRRKRVIEATSSELIIVVSAFPTYFRLIAARGRFDGDLDAPAPLLLPDQKLLQINETTVALLVQGHWHLAALNSFPDRQHANPEKVAICLLKGDALLTAHIAPRCSCSRILARCLDATSWEALGGTAAD
jgi:hypothetical protein